MGSSSGWFAALVTPMSCLSALVANMLSSAVLFLLDTLPIVPFVARLMLLPVFALLPLWSGFTFGGDGYPNRVHVRDLEVGKLLEVR